MTAGADGLPPQVQQLLADRAASGAPPVYEQTVAEARQTMAAAQKAVTP